MLEIKINCLECKIDDIEQYGRRSNLRFTGIKELPQGEDLERKLLDMTNNSIAITSSCVMCSTPLECPSISLFKTICYRHTTTFSMNAKRWGCDHEAHALQRYCEVSQTTHTNFKYKVSGFTINLNMPYMGALPDSVVSCDCC